MNTSKVLMLLTVCLLLVACEKEEPAPIITVQGGGLKKEVPVMQAPCVPSLSVFPAFFFPESQAGNLTLNVSSSMEWTTEVEYLDDWTTDWVSLNPASGAGNSAIAIHITDNPVEIRRQAIITVTAGDLIKKDTIVQHGKPYYGESVTINGIAWATKNVGAVGTFVNFSTNQGKYYKFNRRLGYTYMGGHIEWHSNHNDIAGATIEPVFDPERINETTDWTLLNDPCPESWRLPTAQELENLRISGYRWVDADGTGGPAGAWFGSDAQDATFQIPGNAVFLPAEGLLLDDVVHSVGEGRYWTSNWTKTSSIHGDEGQALIFNRQNGALQVTSHFQIKVCALQIRCVKQ